MYLYSWASQRGNEYIPISMYSVGSYFEARSIKKSKIQSFTLDAILEKKNFNNIKLDLLDIDVEGADLKVLEGFSIQKFRPELICVEIHEKKIKQSKIYDYISNSDYELIWSGVFSHIFRSKS